MGGVWFPPHHKPPHLAQLWQNLFLANIRQALVSTQNPARTITNSNLELLGAITHQEILAAHTNVTKTTNALMNDNMATIHWLCRGLVTSTKAAAYLLQLHALHQHHHCYTTTYDYIPGPKTAMADNCSQLWHLTDTKLLTHFRSAYPQANGWTLCHLASTTNPALTSVLQQQQLKPESYFPGPLPQTVTGPSG